MEALVNYNSEDEQEELMVHATAQRGNRAPSPGKARHSYGNESTMKHQSSSGGGRRETPTTRNNNYRDESSQRQKSTSYGNSNRQESSTHYSRENTRDRDSRDNTRDKRESRRDSRDNARSDNRDEREQRDRRSITKDASRNDFKSDRNRSKDNKSDYNRERENFDNRRPPREDDRRPRDDDRHRRTSSPSSHKNSRYSGNGRDERPRYDSSSSNPTSSTFRPPHHNRSHDHRHSDHHERAQERSISRSRRRSNSRSPSPPSNQRHSYSKRTTHINKSHSRHRSRSRSRSITPKASSSRDRERESYALEQARRSALEMERKIQSDDPAIQNNEAHTTSSQGGVRSNTQALLSLPLSETAPKQPNVIAVAPASISSLNNAEPAVIQLPSYYNPNVINPNKYAEQVQKRKLLWGAKKSEDTAKKWGNAQFSQDTDGRVASKFMRLMGIKGSMPSKGEGEQVEQKALPSVAPDVKTREVMFSNMEQQYEVARQVTHTMRGVGLGFSSQARPF